MEAEADARNNELSARGSACAAPAAGFYGPTLKHLKTKTSATESNVARYPPQHRPLDPGNLVGNRSDGRNPSQAYSLESSQLEAQGAGWTRRKADKLVH